MAKVVIVDADGIRHTFPDGFDPVQAARIVARNKANPEQSDYGKFIDWATSPIPAAVAIQTGANQTANAIEGVDRVPVHASLTDVVKDAPGIVKDIASGLWNNPIATLRGGVAGIEQGIGDTVAAQGTPLGIAATAAGPLGRLTKGIPMLGNAVRVMGAGANTGLGIQGAEQVVNAPDLEGKIMGGVQMALGGHGVASDPVIAAKTRAAAAPVGRALVEASKKPGWIHGSVVGALGGIAAGSGGHVPGSALITGAGLMTLPPALRAAGEHLIRFGEGTAGVQPTAAPTGKRSEPLARNDSGSRTPYESTQVIGESAQEAAARIASAAKESTGAPVDQPVGAAQYLADLKKLTPEARRAELAKRQAARSSYEMPSQQKAAARAAGPGAFEEAVGAQDTAPVADSVPPVEAKVEEPTSLERRPTDTSMEASLADSTVDALPVPERTSRGGIPMPQGLAEPALLTGRENGGIPLKQGLAEPKLLTAGSMEEQLAKATAPEEAAAPTPEETVRLYRGESDAAQAGPDAGSNFTSDPLTATGYAKRGGDAGKTYYIDLPKSEAAKYATTDPTGQNVHVLPADLAAKARENVLGANIEPGTSVIKPKEAAPAEAPKPMTMEEALAQADLPGFEVVDEQGPNASGESAASAESMNRFRDAKQGGDIVVERQGRPDRPIIDPDHYVQTRDNLQPGERLMRVNPDGTKVPVDTGLSVTEPTVVPDNDPRVAPPVPESAKPRVRSAPAPVAEPAAAEPAKAPITQGKTGGVYTDPETGFEMHPIKSVFPASRSGGKPGKPSRRSATPGYTIPDMEAMGLDPNVTHTHITKEQAAKGIEARANRHQKYYGQAIRDAQARDEGM
jgi:hypothetical protein